ncbi:MAG TPA: shikimate dehydrogenase [Bacteroidetes bacterium]|nr:shikimate dehydrogenase [Bacteroidota bacterium]HRR09544.1 N-acetylneuraminate synthase family protein [Rhodothermales bacterium]
MMETYFICEAGQNHNGSMEIARQLIDVAAMQVFDPLFNTPLSGANAIKFTKRDLNEELSVSQMARPYHSAHAFGETYGEHRAKLELDDEQHAELFQYAKAKGLDFIETLCARGCLSMFRLFVPDRLKVASRDLTNLPLLEALAETQIPIILSTGMAEQRELDEALMVITRHHNQISILHCLSQYPAEYPNINLRTITWLQKHYPAYTIGYSDHSVGIMVPVAAVALGAHMIEKHITLDRTMKGSDHWGSLESDGLRRILRDIRNLERALGEEKMSVDPVVTATRTKLERSIASLRKIPAGTRLLAEDLHLLSPGDGFKWRDLQEVVGRMAAQDIPANEVIYPHMLQNAPSHG